MTADVKARIADLAVSAPLIVFLGIAISGLWGELIWPPSSVTVYLVDGAAVLNMASIVCVMVLLIVRRPPLRKAQGWAPRAAGLAGFLFPLTFVALPRAELTPLLLGASNALTLAGSLAAIFVYRWLGAAFSILPQARGLVTGGPYRYVRHPLYLAEFVFIAGVALEYRQPWPELAMLGISIVQLPRMAFEERVLSEAFPDYRDYANRTARLIPGVY